MPTNKQYVISQVSFEKFLFIYWEQREVKFIGTKKDAEKFAKIYEKKSLCHIGTLESYENGKWKKPFINFKNDW